MSNLLLGSSQLTGNFIEETFHGLFSIKHGSDLLIACNIVFHLFLQRFVDPFELKDVHEALVYIRVETLILSDDIRVLFSKSLSLDNSLIELSLGCPEGVL